MKLKLLIAAALLCLALPAAADFQTISRAYEVEPSNLTIPTSQNGRVLFKNCDECATRAVRLTPNTRFVVNGRSIRFEKFRRIANGIGNAEPELIGVLHHLESDTVVSLSLTVRKQGNKNQED